MERYSDRAIEIINEMHTERLDYESEYLPLIDCANRCKAYEDALEQELLVRLPCRAGNMLWTFYNWPEKKVYSAKVLSVSTLDTKTTIHTDRLGIFPSQDIGKTVFLTREEAEAALKEARHP